MVWKFQFFAKQLKNIIIRVSKLNSFEIKKNLSLLGDVQWPQKIVGTRKAPRNKGFINEN